MALQETERPEQHKVSLTVDERLTELDMGSFTGSKYDEIMEKHGNVFRCGTDEDYGSKQMATYF